jgi:hypothetical protein
MTKLEYDTKLKVLRDRFYREIAAWIELSPELTYAEIAGKLGCSAATVATAAAKNGCRRPCGRPKAVTQ